jgi:hypothetical protein
MNTNHPSPPRPASRVTPSRRVWVVVTTAILSALGIPLIPLGADYLNYVNVFEIARTASFEELMSQRYEPLFLLFSTLFAKLSGDDVLVFAVLMVTSTAMKVTVTHRLAGRGLAAALVLAWYALRFFPLHELTQIRIALALGLWLLAVTTQSGRKAFLLAVAAALTHYSTAVLLPVLWAWRAAERSPAAYRRIETPLLLGGVAVIVMITLTLRQLLEQLSLIFSILDIYSNEGFGEDRVNPFSIAVLLDSVFLLTGWMVASSDVRSRFWLTLLTLSLATFYVLFDFPVLAHRIREMFGICWLPYLAFTLNQRGAPRLHAQLIIAASIPAYLYLDFFGTFALFPIG